MKQSLLLTLFILCALISCSSKKEEISQEIRCSKSDFLNQPLEHQQFVENAKCLNWKNNYPDLIEVISKASDEDWNQFGSILNSQFFGKNIFRAKDLASGMPVGVTRVASNLYLENILNNLVANDLDVISKIVEKKQIRAALFEGKSIFKIAEFLSNQKKTTANSTYKNVDHKKLKELILVALKDLTKSDLSRGKTLKMLRKNFKGQFWLPITNTNTADLVFSLRTIFEMPQNYPMILEKMQRFEIMLKKNSLICKNNSQGVEIKTQPLMHEQIRIVFSSNKNYQKVAKDLMALKAQINGFLQICSHNEDLKVLSSLVNDYVDLFKNKEIFQIIYNVHQHLGVLDNNEIETFIEFFNSEFYRQFVTLFNTWDNDTKDSFVLSLVQLFENLIQDNDSDFLKFISNLLSKESLFELDDFLTELSDEEWSGVFKTIRDTNSLKSNFFYSWLEKNVSSPLAAPLEEIFKNNGEDVSRLLSYFSQQLSKNPKAKEDLNRFIRKGAIYDLIGVLGSNSINAQVGRQEEIFKPELSVLDKTSDCSQDFKAIAFGNTFNKNEMNCPWLIESSLILKTIDKVREFEKMNTGFSLASESSIKLYFSVLLLLREDINSFSGIGKKLIPQFIEKLKVISRQNLQKINFKKALFFTSSLLRSFNANKDQVLVHFSNRAVEKILSKEKTGKDIITLADQWLRDGINLANGKKHHLMFSELFEFVKAASDSKTKKNVTIKNRDGSPMTLELTSFERLGLLLKNATFLDGFFGSTVVNKLAVSKDFYSDIRSCQNKLAAFKLAAPFYSAINPNVKENISINISNLLELLPVMNELGPHVDLIQSFLLVLAESSPEETRSMSFLKWSNFEVNREHKFNKLMAALGDLDWNIISSIMNQAQESKAENLNPMQNILMQNLSSNELRGLLERFLGEGSLFENISRYQVILEKIYLNYDAWEVDKFIGGIGLDGKKNFFLLERYLSFLGNEVFGQPLTPEHEMELKKLLDNFRNNVTDL